MELIIRDYGDADRDDVNRVALAAFDQYEGQYEDWASFRDGIGRMAELASAADLIVADRGGVVGAVAHVAPGGPRAAMFPAHWSILRMLVVAPSARGQGIARHLTAAALERALQAGAPVVGLHTSPIMEKALAMYLGIGFVLDCALPPIRGVPYGRYVLEREAIAVALRRLGHDGHRRLNHR